MEKVNPRTSNISSEPQTIMIKVEQDCQEKGEGNGQKDISNVKVPEMYQPRSIQRGEERLASRKNCDIDVSHMADVDEAGEEYNDQRRSVVFKELANISIEEIAVTQFSADPCSHQHQKRHRNGQVC